MNLLTKKYGRSIGLYAFNETPQEIEKIKKGICKIFCDNDLKITINANLTVVNFLDVTLDLKSGKHSPYSKPGNIPLYVHNKSNHPPSILKNIPELINKRLCEISSDKECFDKAKPINQDALNASGYRYKLTFKETPQKQKRKRQRNITWYNPPYSKSIETNVGKCFLTLVDQHFPKTHPLHKIFNRNTLKLSYSCMSNVKTIITNHNKATIHKSKPIEGKKSNCKCRNKSKCPMNGNCEDESIIHQALVTTQVTKETYIGLCDTTFKARYSNHICSFSKHIWGLKDKNIKYDIIWSKVKQTKAYTNISKRCNLCLWENFFISCKPSMASLNKKSELMSTCRHAKKFLLNTPIT